MLVYGKIYATWCGACTAFADTWNAVVARVGADKEMSIEDSEMAIKRGEFAKKFGTSLPEIDGYPTVYRLKGRPGEGATVELYSGPRTVEDLVRWLS